MWLQCLGALLENGSMLIVNDKSGKSLKVLTYFAQ